MALFEELTVFYYCLEYHLILVWIDLVLLDVEVAKNEAVDAFEIFIGLEELLGECILRTDWQQCVIQMAGEEVPEILVLLFLVVENLDDLGFVVLIVFFFYFFFSNFLCWVYFGTEWCINCLCTIPVFSCPWIYIIRFFKILLLLLDTFQGIQGSFLSCVIDVLLCNLFKLHLFSVFNLNCICIAFIMNGQLSLAVHILSLLNYMNLWIISILVRIDLINCNLSGFEYSKHRTTFRRCCFGFLFGGLLLLVCHLYDDAVFGISVAALLVAVLDTFDFEVFLFDVLFLYFFLDCLSDFVLWSHWLLGLYGWRLH